MYNEALASVDSLIRPACPASYIHSYQSYVCLFSGGDGLSMTVYDIDKANIKRNRLMHLLEKRGIATRQGTHAVHTLSFYKNKYNLDSMRYINAYAADRLSISLPLYASMTAEEFDYVISNIKECLTCVV